MKTLAVALTSVQGGAAAAAGTGGGRSGQLPAAGDGGASGPLSGVLGPGGGELEAEVFRDLVRRVAAGGSACLAVRAICSVPALS